MTHCRDMLRKSESLPTSPANRREVMYRLPAFDWLLI